MEVKLLLGLARQLCWFAAHGRPAEKDRPGARREAAHGPLHERGWVTRAHFLPGAFADFPLGSAESPLVYEEAPSKLGAISRPSCCTVRTTTTRTNEPI